MDAVFLVIVEMFDNFGDGWGGGLRLVVRTLGGGRSLSRSLSLSGGALEHSLSLPDGMSSARESFGLTQIRTACKPSLLHASEGGCCVFPISIVRFITTHIDYVRKPRKALRTATTRLEYDTRKVCTVAPYM